MIRYALACDSGHTFESWFPSSDAYEAQAARGLVTCPACDSPRVGKQIMAPSVARTDRPRQPGLPVAESPAVGAAGSAGDGAAPGLAPAGALPAGAALPAPVPHPEVPALMSEERRALREAAAQLRAYVETHAENVGRRFAEEARAIHEGDAPERFIMGQADRDEVAELIEDGIPIAPLPVLPDERN